MIKNPDRLPPKEIKTSKDYDSQSVSIFVSGFAMTYVSVYAIIVCGTGFSVKAFILPIPLGIIGGLASLFLTSFGAGSFVDFLTGRRKANWTIREKLAGDVNRIKYFKREGRFEEALGLADTVLSQDPKFPEVLFLQAQILWEGFGDDRGAKESLLKIRQNVPSDQPIHIWAVNYQNEIREYLD
ncbi:MAG: tetratricopeptide repeat protein [Deltaproteobacteria bacterium]|nr:tetratricopeptide repeat protein [Deltaproteobacteria bacterium]MBF0525955.1 tetratricopeptide repeat protein [Deltaproteobacteria bacterium]